MENLVHQRKNLVLILVKQAQNIAWVFIIMMVIVIYLLMEKKSLTLKPTIKMLIFKLNFVQLISNRFSATESREVSLNRIVLDFSVDYDSIDKSDMLNTHKYLMTKNNKEIRCSLTKQVLFCIVEF